MKPPQPSSPAAHRLLALPDGVVSIVLANLFSPEDIHATTKAIWQQHRPPPVPVFASVCKAWRTLIHEIASANALSHLTISLGKPTRQSTVELRRQLILRRTHTQTLSLEHAPNVDRIDGVTLWRAVFSHAPHTKLLDLSTIKEDSRTHLMQFLAAAGSNLPRVHTLYLPQYKMDDPPAQWMDKMTGEMIKALELWRVRGEVGGLRVLRASLGDYMSDYNGAYEMVDALARYCPNLEQLEMSDGQEGICREQWKLDLRTWTRLCQSCSSFTEFDWVRVPFATSFFEVFGQHTQPKLRKLNLRPAANWDWPNYMADALPAQRTTLEISGFGGKATNAWAVLKACPNLRELLVEWKFASTPDAVAMNMTPEVFGDEFHEKLAQSCPRLERFTSAARTLSYEAWPMIESLTDRSLRALAKLSRLEFVELSAKNITGDAVYDLVVDPVTTSVWTKREYRILVGESQQDAATGMATFYHILLRFLQRLADEEDPSAFAARPRWLLLANNSARTAGEAWYSHYLAQVKELVGRIQQLYPTVSMEIGLVQKQDYRWSHQIAWFGFSTHKGSTEKWECGTFTQRQGVYIDSRIDSVFIRRSRHEFYWPSDDESDMEDEP